MTPDLRCSAKACSMPARYALLWRNPRIHTPDRVKRWLACDQHRESLSDFLARRDFPVTVEELTVEELTAEELSDGPG